MTRQYKIQIKCSEIVEAHNKTEALRTFQLLLESMSQQTIITYLSEHIEIKEDEI